MKIFAYVVLLIYVTLCIGGASATVTYRSYVDFDYGFYNVVGTGVNPANDTANESTYFANVNYTDKKLTINVGDTLLWINYDPQNWPLTIMSKQGLWNGNASYLRQMYKMFNYTFTEPGTYVVYVKEKDKFSQTIIVNPVYTPAALVTPANDVIKTPGPTETPIKTSQVTQTQVPVIPEKTPTRMISGPIVTFIIGVIAVTVGVLLILKGRKKR